VSREEYEPFGSVAAAVFFLKRSCSRLVTKKYDILFTGSHLFSALCFFCTVHVIALFNEQCN
jgi:hypothetical protein